MSLFKEMSLFIAKLLPLGIRTTSPTDPETKDIIARNHQTTTNIYQPRQTTDATTPSHHNILLLTLY